MIRISLIIGFFALFLAVQDRSIADDAEYTRPFSVVMYHDGDVEELKARAQKVAGLIGAKIIQAAPKNPVCCVWLEITGWTPNPGKPGYVIIHQPGGSVILASNVEQMDLAIKRFQSESRQTENGVLVPLGLMTNYKIVE